MTPMGPRHPSIDQEEKTTGLLFFQEENEDTGINKLKQHNEVRRKPLFEESQNGFHGSR